MVSKKASSERKYECHKCWVEMKKEEVETFGPNIIIDVCPKCNGVWLDKGELGKLLKDRKMSNYLTKHIGTKSRSPLICPRCANIMDIEKADDVEVDVCLTCGGVWLDSGELEELKAKSKEGFEGDELAKMEELDEERRYKARNSLLNKLLGKLK
ncbi:MAG: zf-TFIIB domain-containing protein [Thermoplasmatales archaeon]|nr:zf-TFIIB domain-containing protein [Thermoplasmatales archaeon]